MTKEYIKKQLDSKELYELSLKEKNTIRYIGMAISKKHLPNFSAKKLIEIICKDNNFS